MNSLSLSLFPLDRILLQKRLLSDECWDPFINYQNTLAKLEVWHGMPQSELLWIMIPVYLQVI